MELTTLAILFFVGIIAGVFNSIAGGATFISFPVLMASGLPPLVANATNFVALLPSNAAAVPAFKDELLGLGRRLWVDMAICAAGGLVGVLVLLWLGEGTFTKLLPWLMLSAVIIFAAGRQIRKGIEGLLADRGSDILGRVLLFFFSIYGGYFGAGLGVILLASFTIAGYTNAHIANAMKNAAGTVIALVSIGVVASTGLVAWPQAFAMMAGATIGGAAGGVLSKKLSQPVMRFLVIAFGLLVSAVYLWRAYGP
ncbi:sulfite exporter TauE/SafE family protein [Pseudahrensia aquimaris]|uniref:Probable membrane transporter protein n=1 Tax=Pseudahrensia aquimaris TaxID=744461 RepID=A0ABW3FF15_9HYPH